MLERAAGQGPLPPPSRLLPHNSVGFCLPSESQLVPTQGYFAAREIFWVSSHLQLWHTLRPSTLEELPSPPPTKMLSGTGG